MNLKLEQRDTYVCVCVCVLGCVCTFFLFPGFLNMFRDKDKCGGSFTFSISKKSRPL